MGSHCRNCTHRTGILYADGKGVSGRCCSDPLPWCRAGDLAAQGSDDCRGLARPPEPDRPHLLFAVSLALARLGLLSILYQQWNAGSARDRSTGCCLDCDRNHFIPLRRTPVSPATNCKGRPRVVDRSGCRHGSLAYSVYVSAPGVTQPHIIQLSGNAQRRCHVGISVQEATLIAYRSAVLYVRRALVE